MSRPLRIQYPGAIYHITARGNAKKSIFSDDQDREQFLFILANTMEKFNWLCHAFVLMDNHYHLVIETIDPTMSKGMRQLNGVYTQWSHEKYDSVGHILQGRFKGFLVEEAPYLLNVVRYVILNPVRASMVSDPAEFPWSSYGAMMGKDMLTHLVTTKKVLEKFDNNKQTAQQKFREFLLGGVGLPSPFNGINGVILGSDQFIDEMHERLQPTENEKEIVKASRMAGRPTLQELFDGVESTEERNAAIKLAIGILHYSGAEVGRFLHLDASTMCKIASKNS